MIPLYDDNPTSRPPVITVTLIAVSVAVFLGQISLSEQAATVLIYRLGAIPAVVTGEVRLHPDLAGAVPAQATLFTSMFLHGGFLHLAGNMLYLWIFGNNVEDALGHFRFLLFYLAGGVVAALAHIYMDPVSEVPMIGASGAISGVLGAYLLLYPKAQVAVLIPIGIILQLVRLPAVVVLLLWFLFQFLSNLFASAQEGGGGVAWMAHIGGFVAGILLLFLFKRRSVPLFGDGR
ncbi:rhomboid family intramembrane serine protease [Thiohalorhabdus sp. Cl-TMA]|uniref:Rhomboid family intramembrane serine protease n=1 Tax=Thiohalorhabdus methylotrophus TaxID=3242694 RepID=A0ABV4TZN6_9GAMM